MCLRPAGRCVVRQAVGVGERERRGGGARQCKRFSEKRRQHSKDSNEVVSWKIEQLIEGRETRRVGR